MSLSPTQDCGQSPEVSSRTMSEGHLLGHGDSQPLFEGFPLSGEGRDPVDADRIISMTKHHLLAQPLGPAVVPMSSGFRGSPLYAVPPASSAPTMGLRGRVCRPCMISGGGVGPRLVVRRQSSAVQRVSRVPPAGRPRITVGGRTSSIVSFRAGGLASRYIPLSTSGSCWRFA